MRKPSLLQEGRVAVVLAVQAVVVPAVLAVAVGWPA